jgi:hypothetical protein
MRRLFLFILCATSLFAQDVPRASAPMDIEQELFQKESRLEQLYADYWRTQYAADSGDSKASTLDIQKQIRAVVTEPEFLARLKAARFKDKTAERRRQLFLNEAIYTSITTDEALAKLVEEITNDEAAIRYKVGDKELKRSEVNNILGHEPDRKLREQAWWAEEQLTAKTGERIRQAMKMRIALAQKYAHQPLPDVILAHKGIQSRKQVMVWFEEIRKATEPEYQQLLARMKRELKVETLEPWDLDYYFSTLTGGFEEKKFVPADTWDKVKQVSLALGFDYSRLPVDATITEITFGGGTYPILYGREVKILVNKYQGIRFVDTLFHESGHALHYSFNCEPRFGTSCISPVAPSSTLQVAPSQSISTPRASGFSATGWEQQQTGSTNNGDDHSFILEANMPEPFDEGLGQVMSLLIYRPTIARKYFGLTPDQITAINQRYRLKSLYDLRGTMADSVFEFAAYASPDQDLNALYDRINEQYLGVKMHGAKVFAYDPFYSSGPIYLQSYVLAEMVGRQIHYAMEQRFGPDWDSDPRAGAYLREKFFSRGARLSFDQIMLEGTGERLTPKWLLEAMLSHN